MKVTTLFALFLLFAFTAHLPSATADFVVDTDGEPIRNGGTYYILPVIRGRGGGVERAQTGNETCPLTVVQSPSELSNGLPIRISSPYRILYIYEGLILDLSFTAVPLCAPTPSKWTIVKGLPDHGWAVKLSGYENTVQGWFKIEKYLLDYRIVFCTLSSNTCGDIGIKVDDDGNRLLVVTDKDPFVVQFKKDSYSAA